MQIHCIHVIWLNTPLILTGGNPNSLLQAWQRESNLWLLRNSMDYILYSCCAGLETWDHWITSLTCWPLSLQYPLTAIHYLHTDSVSLWMLWKELHCTLLYNNLLMGRIFQSTCIEDEDCLPVIRENKMLKSTGRTFPIAVAPAVMCEKLNWFWVPTINGARTSVEKEKQENSCVTVKVKLRLKFLNLG